MWLSLLAAFVVASAIAVAVPWLRAGGAGGIDATPTASRSLFVALHCSGEVCDRIVNDLVRRTPLADADRLAGQHAVLAVLLALPRETEADCPALADYCLIRYRPAEPDQVADDLAAAGYAGATVRTARGDDPAPAGAVVFAVPVGPACLVGYHAADTGPSDIQVAGQLPDGTCLAR
jgi:hypothetical protein